ncbi:MAG TPA: hypothetical protein VJ865_08150 [Gemmatimonadaceae bacterium]|nr:hypothetical protein [Gemmatimonadaceae bacterium]
MDCDPLGITYNHGVFAPVVLGLDNTRISAFSLELTHYAFSNSLLALAASVQWRAQC